MEETEPPFTSEIMNAMMPPRFRMPPTTPYSGFGDPTKHMESYRSWMELQSASRPIICRAFSITLIGAARGWYRQLKPRSISSFVELSKAFLTQFIVRKQRRKPSAHLLTIKQKDGDALKDYILRFNGEAMQVNDYSDKMALATIISGLKEGKFLFSIEKNPPTTMGEFMNRAEKYSNAEDFFSSRKGTHHAGTSFRDKKRKDAPFQLSASKKRSDEDGSRSQIPSRKPDSRFCSYTPLNKSLEWILLDI
ncbi:uncharacterized protein LOC131241366 [Magnolia sinica]|uniref:uncharacterized protein LOC131241366 n=1 Tax=Magnolia sinica TaxID=86752 RepID=UPI00265A6450|nr:uncharacterized protein LOC131241366 [Magnolia sinica]